MKKKLLFILICMVFISLASFFIISAITKDEKSNDIKVVTSFYPIYTIAKNIVGDTDNIEVVNLTDYQTGCLHDYQVTTGDMRKLEDAEVLVINGGGMEGFLQNVLEFYPNIPIIDSSKGIALLESSDSHDHDEEDQEEDDAHEHEDNEHGAQEHEDDDHSHEYNAHIWLNMDYYIKQIKNVKEGLVDLDPSNGSIYESNSNKYIKEIRNLQSQYKSKLTKFKDVALIIFHDSFAYVADEFGLNMVHIVNVDENTYLSAGQISEIINKIEDYDVKILLSEAQYSVSIAKTIADETDARVYIIDSIVSGDNDKEAYIKGMAKNLEILENAFKKNWSFYE